MSKILYLMITLLIALLLFASYVNQLKSRKVYSYNSPARAHRYSYTVVIRLFGGERLSFELFSNHHYQDIRELFANCDDIQLSRGQYIFCFRQNQGKEYFMLRKLDIWSMNLYIYPIETADTKKAESDDNKEKRSVFVDQSFDTAFMEKRKTDDHAGISEVKTAKEKGV